MRDEDILRMGLDNLCDGDGDLSKKVGKGENMKMKEDEVEKIVMKDYSRLLLVLFVLKVLGYVHRDIRPANILRDATTGNLTLIDFAFSCEDGEENYFAGGVSCASSSVLNQLVKNPNAKFEMSWRDDLNSWVRCWILVSNGEIAEMHRLLDRSDNLSSAARIFREFWSSMGLFPSFGEDVDMFLGMEDIWEVVNKVPELMSFISYVKPHNRKEEDDERLLKVGISVFETMFKVVLRAVIDYVLRPGSYVDSSIKIFVDCYDCSSLLNPFTESSHVRDHIGAIINSFCYNQKEKLKELKLELEKMMVE
jgi:serine/threonine protein kinase